MPVPVCLMSEYLPLFMSVDLSIACLAGSGSQSVCLFMFVCMQIYMAVSVFQSIFIVCLSVYLSVCLSVCLSVHMSVCLSV